MSPERLRGPRFSDVLRRREFRYLFCGISVSRFGDSMTFVIISWLALSAGGPRAVGLVVFGSGAVSAAAAPVIGYLLDRLGVRALMLADNLGRSALMLGLAALAWRGPVRLGELLAFSVAAALLSPATEVGQAAATPMLVPAAGLDAASRLLSGSWTVLAGLGPVLAGLALGTAGAAPVLLTDALTFLVMAAIARLMPGRPQNAGPAGVAALSGPAGLLAGFRLLWQLRPVAVLTAVSVGVLFLHGMMEVFLPAFSKLTLHQGPAQYGLLVSAAEVTSLGGTLLLAPLAGRLGPGPALAAMLAARGLAIFPLVFAGSRALGVTLASAAAVPEGAVFPVLAATTQRLIPAAVRGRVQGAAGALGAAGFPLGSALGGLLVAAAGSRITVIVMAAGYLPLTAAVIRAPQLRRSRPGAHAAGTGPAGEHVLRKPA